MVNDIVIFSNTLANELIDNGFTIKRVGNNRKDVKEVVFYFKRTSRLEQYLKEKRNITL